jgi:hypothetical protein
MGLCLSFSGPIWPIQSFENLFANASADDWPEQNVSANAFANSLA